MVHTLYWSSFSGSLAPLCLLIEGGVPHDTVQVRTKEKEHKTDVYLRDIHPLGTVPALRLPDGRVLLESAAMVLHLAELAPALAPAPGSTERPMYLQWVAYGSGTLYPAYQRIYHVEDMVPDEAARPAAKELAMAGLAPRWKVVDDALAAGSGPYLFGDTASAADIYLAMLALWHPEQEPFAAACPKVRAMKNAVWKIPSMQQALKVHGLPTE
ncbi:glutathione S-transferase family protein [Thalassobaculum litoreum]|uniref:Glutathione S-transferase n=1 Tax=Thalassobaculum litoreum DSM 18839 TaxID=1123362 RepID=A0A8G2BL45_9PROT|nr:glutathione S-transferase family protein [Thalassobaculum litoreum]SDG34124.1 glutathione S-transferase [Thalassobaculum litoreum DSM 18839]